jgi:GTP pyrophosphokinase
MWPSPFAFLGIASLSLDFAAAWGNVRPSWHLPHEHRGRPLWNADEPVGPDSISKWATLLHPASDREARLNNRPAEMHEKSNATAALAIEGYWKELHPLLPHLGADDTKKVELALRVAYCAHDGQMRKSGEPYIIHPIAVAGLLAQIKMDTDTIISGLLHDTVEDTELTFLQVELLFGPTVRRIVEGETKVSKLPRIALGNTASGIATPGNSDPNPYLDEQAENLRQMFIAMSEDYRIIVVKLADRLHNMRTLAHMSPEKQQEKSRETLEIFAPLAHRLGIWQFKSELEELAFMYLFPEEFSDLQVLLEGHGAKHRDMLAESKSVLLERLQEDLMLKEREVQKQSTNFGTCFPSFSLL